MKRRNLLIGVGTAAGTSMALGSGAFSTVEANRQAEVTVTGDSNAYLALGPGDQNGAFVDEDDGQVVLDFSGNRNGGVGVGGDSTYTFDDTLWVQNQGTSSTYVWTSVESSTFADGAFYLYTHSNRDTQFSEGDAVELGIGESIPLGVYIDTTEISTDSYDVDLTIHGAGEPPQDGSDDGGDEESEPVPEELIGTLSFDSTASLLGTDTPGSLPDGELPGDPGGLTDEQIVVRAEAGAQSVDEDGNGDSVPYGDDDPLPLMAYDDGIFAAGVPFVQDDTAFAQYGNDELFLNLFDRELGSGTVLWDEGHGQFYDLAAHTAIETYVEDADYTLSATTDIAADLADADGVVITSPADTFSDAELEALASFADDGGLVVLMDQSDYNNFDATSNLNEIAAALSTAIRFNDNQVLNGDGDFAFTTTQFNTDDHPSLFGERAGIGLELDRDESYEVDVVSVADGDTADVQFADGTEKTVRILGVDTAETGGTEERIEEYEGVTDGDALREEADAASAYAEDLLNGETVTLTFDDNEPLRGSYGRLLGYLELPNGDVYNERVIEDGYARLYSSGFANHDRYWDHERAARDAGTNLWSVSDTSAVPESGDSAVESLFFPEAVAVSGGTTVVSSEGDDPLVALDDDAGVAVLGGPIVDEEFESDEGGPGIEGYGQYPFLTNVIDRLAGGIDGRVLIDGGHGQFNAGFSIAAEDAAYYQRYLEGQSTAALDSIAFQPTNDLLDDNGPALLDGDETVASALVVSTPTEALSTDERDRITTFADAGGAVVLLGTAADTDALGNFDPLLADLDADVGFTTTAVTDGDDNLAGASNPATTNFADGTELFDPFTASTDGGGESPSVTIVEVSGETEYVLMENTGSATVEMENWSVGDAADHTYTFPATALGAGETVVVSNDGKSGGTVPDADILRNWDEGYVWNNGGDTATLADADGETVDSYSY